MSAAHASGKWFEDFRVGQEFVTPARTVTETDVVNFAGVSGDFLSLHTDAVYAETSRFKKRVVHGAFTFAALMGLWQRLGVTEGTLDALVGCDRLRFVKPVFIGDTISARLRVTEVRPRDRDGRVKLLAEVWNQRGDLVMSTDVILLFRRRGNAGA